MTMINPGAYKPVSRDDGPNLRAFLSRQDFYFCDYTFVNLYIWGEISALRWQIANGRLWIYSFQKNRLFMPLGEPVDEGDLLRASDSMIAGGYRGDFVFAEQDFIDAHPGLDRHFAIEPEPGNADYVYLAQRLFQLSGSKLAKKKNLIAQFRREYPDSAALPLAPDDADECLDLAERWCRIRSCDQVGYKHETSALRKALGEFGPLGMEGVKLIVDGRMIAYAIFSALNAQTADVHFEKYDPLIKGAPQVINWETARICSGHFKYINREQDLGIPGLRQAKKSYDPACILMSYFLRRL